MPEDLYEEEGKLVSIEAARDLNSGQITLQVSRATLPDDDELLVSRN